MRRAGAEHWVRFHSLPLSKRYADTEAERPLLLTRQNAFADDVLGVCGSCWLVQSFWETPAGSIDSSGHLDPRSAWPNYQFQFAFYFLAHADDDETRAWNVHASRQTWRSGAFDDLLLAIADDDAAPTLWMSRAAGAVFAPYDGGVDLFLPDPAQVR